MKQLKKDLQSITKSLKAMTRQTEEMVKRLDKLEKTQTVKRPKVKTKSAQKTAVKKQVKKRAIDTLLSIIIKSRKGVDAATLKKKTGFEGWKLYDNIHRLKKQGKIKSVGKGVYMKA